MVQVISVLIGVFMAISIIIVRLKAAKKPTNTAKIILPPIFMSTGFAMFFAPKTHMPFIDAVGAFLLGALFSVLLIKTSKFEIRGNDVYLKRSKAFIFILFGLLIIRTMIKIFLEKDIHINLAQTSAMFFILAFGMILPWRIAMFVMYRKMVKQVESNEKDGPGDMITT